MQGGVALIASTASVQGKGQSKSSASLAIKALRTHLGIPTLSHRSCCREKNAKRPENDTNHVLLVAPFPGSAPRLFPRLSQRDPFLQIRREGQCSSAEGAQRFLKIFISHHWTKGCELPEPWQQDRKITHLQHMPLHRHTVRRCTASHGTANSLKAYASGGCPLVPAQRGHSGMAYMPQKE